VDYYQREYEASLSRNIRSNEQQHEKEGSFLSFDEAAFDIDVFQLVDIGKWMFGDEFECGHTLENSEPGTRSNCNPIRKHRSTQDSLNPAAAKFYFPNGFPQDYKPPEGLATWPRAF
jgi:hypothetical protein